MKLLKLIPACLAGLMIISSCKNEDKKNETTNSTETKKPALKEENTTYSSGTVEMNGYLVYDTNISGPRPAVLVVHEWWGMNDYSKLRARQLAEMGYAAFAIDMYGDGKTADNPGDAEKLAMPFYMHPDMAKEHFDAALSKLKSYAQVDSTKIAAIGYCFGGGMLINLARLGENINGIVSFHGTLLGTPANKDLLKSKMLVCQGGADSLVPAADIAAFKHQMDSIGADYKFITYPNAQHSFTNPNSTAMGEKFKMPISYNAAADTASWNDMRAFLNGLFRQTP